MGRVAERGLAVNHKRRRAKAQRAGCYCGGKLAKSMTGVGRGARKVYGSSGSWLRLQVRAFPPLQQSAVILALLFLNEFLLFWLDGVAGHPVTDWRRWLSVPVGAACWPLVTGFYSRIAARR